MSQIGDLAAYCTHPEHPAVIDINHIPARRTSYEQLSTLANRVANMLKNRGYKIGDRIAIQSLNSAEMIATYLGILRFGGVVVFVNAHLPQAQVEYILQDSESQLLITDQDITASIPIVKYPLSDDIGDKDFNSVDVADSDLAMILYTSGSTGKPKGVLLSHASHTWAVVQKTVARVNLGRVSLLAPPISHMGGLINVGANLAGGATTILMSKFDPKTFIKAIPEYRVNFISAVPTMMAMVVNETELLQATDLSTVETIILASAPCSYNLMVSLKKCFPKTQFRLAYGSTEAGPGLFGGHPDHIPIPMMSVGYPLPDVSCKLIDGMLYVKSPSLLMKYSNTKDALTEDGYFITNDLFRVDKNGFYYFVGRADDMFTCGGYNVYPRQVEVIIEELPGVIAAAVIGIEDEIKGGKPYAFVVGNVTEEAVKNHVLLHLPKSHCPRKVWIIDSMPMGANGKINKAELSIQAKKLLA